MLSQQAEDDHFDLACCTHYIVSGKDLMAEVKSYRKAKQIRFDLQPGMGKMDILSRTLYSKAGALMPVLCPASRHSVQVMAKYSPDQLTLLTAVTRESQEIQELPPEQQLLANSEWQEKDEYCTRWKQAGFETDAHQA